MKVLMQKGNSTTKRIKLFVMKMCFIKSPDFGMQKSKAQYRWDESWSGCFAIAVNLNQPTYVDEYILTLSLSYDPACL